MEFCRARATELPRPGRPPSTAPSLLRQAAGALGADEDTLGRAKPHVEAADVPY